MAENSAPLAAPSAPPTALHATPAAAALQAPIVAVEVFRASAVVRRRGALRAGDDAPTQLELLDLPLGIVDRSLRASVDPPGACTIADLQVVIDAAAPVETREVAERARLDELLREQSALQQQRQGLEDEIAQLLRQQAIAPPLPRDPDREWFPTDDPTAGWLALMALVREQTTAKQQQLHELVARGRALREALRLAEDALARVSTASTSRLRVGKKIALRLAGPPRQACCVELSYQVPGARWFPSYELRFSPDGAKAELTMSALLGQATGEDWAGVQLALSTADLQRRNDLPQLPALRIGRAQQPRPGRAWRPLPDDLEQLFADFDEHQPPPPGAGEHDVTREHRPAGGIDHHDTREYGAIARDAPPLPVAMEWDSASGSLEQLDDDRGRYEPEEETRDEDDGLDEETLGDAAPRRMQAARPAPAAPAAAAPPPSASMAMAPAGSASYVPGEAKPVPPAAPRAAGPARRREELAPAEELLSFGGLVLPPATAPDRGRLRPAGRQELLAQPELAGQLADAEAQLAYEQLRLRTRPVPRWVCGVEQSAGHFAHRYETQAAAQIPADGQLHRVTIARESVPVALCYRTVPRVEPAVYRLATLANPLARPLLAGPLDVCWGNDFLVTARLETTAVGATIEANLGVEPRIKVARNVKHSEHEAGLLAGRVVYEEQIEVEIRNGVGRPATVEVFERVPVTEEKKLDVKLVDEQPRGEEYTQQERQRPIRGGRRYRLQLGADAQQRVVLRYTMTLPAGSEIDGGGRRA